MLNNVLQKVTILLLTTYTILPYNSTTTQLTGAHAPLLILLGGCTGRRVTLFHHRRLIHSKYQATVHCAMTNTRALLDNLQNYCSGDNKGPRKPQKQNRRVIPCHYQTRDMPQRLMRNKRSLLNCNIKCVCSVTKEIRYMSS